MLNLRNQISPEVGDDKLGFSIYKMMKTIFISGVAGFLGSYLAEEMIKDGRKVIGCDNLIGGYIDNVPDEVDFHQVDCGYLNTMNKLLKGVDIVYHTACTAYEGLSVFSPHLVSQNTFQITSTLASAAISQKIKRFVNCSSMARYGIQEISPYTEEMDPRPQDPYGISKLAAENLLNCLSHVHGIEVVHAVPHNIIGPRQKYDDPFRNVVSIMINLMLQGRQPIIYGDGSQVRCFSFINDVISCLKKMAFQSNVVGETINIGPDEEFVTILELAEIIADVLNFRLDPMFVNERPQEIKLAKCSADKARKLLGYKTEYSLRRGIQEMIEYISKKGVKRFRYHLDIEIINDLTPKTWTDKLF
jgi:UDP-glucose 4-epimerase